jgi:uncharacterized membrane protein YqgA involved in biofilm formation
MSQLSTGGPLESERGRRGRGLRRRGISGFGLILVIAGLFGLAVAYSVLPSLVYKLWPVILIAVGVFGLLKRPGWVQELDLFAGSQVSRAALAPQRFLSWILLVAGLVLLAFSLNVVDQRLFGPALLIALGLFLIWRRSR